MYYMVRRHTFIVQRSRSVHRTVKPIINQSMKQQVPRWCILINEVILQIRKINMFTVSQTGRKLMLFHDSVLNAGVTWSRMVWQNDYILRTSNQEKGRGHGLLQRFTAMFIWRTEKKIYEKTSVCVLAEIRDCYGRNRNQKRFSLSLFARLGVTGRLNMAQLRPAQPECAVAKKLSA
jgi:hypothetical protein